MSSPAKTFAEVTGALSSSRVLGHSVGLPLSSGEAAALRRCLVRSARHAWLALEVALAGPPLWDVVLAFLPPRSADPFRQQMDTLLDLLSLAGLGTEQPETCRLCREEMRCARRAGHLAEDEGRPAPCRDRNGSAGRDEGSGSDPLGSLAGDLERAGYPSLARLLGLRPWRDQPLVVSMVEYFLRRGLRGEPALGPAFADLPEAPAGYGWRCLEAMTTLLDEHLERVVGAIDEPAASAFEELPPAVEELLRLGVSLFDRAEYRRAIAQFTAALDLCPTHAGLYSRRANAHHMLSEFDRAIGDLSRALELNPKDPSLLVSRASAAHLAGDHERAIADCDAALALSPEEATAYRARAAIHADRGDDDGARADLSEAIALEPDDIETLHQRGVLAARQRGYTQAVADFDRVLEISPNYVLAFFHRAHARRGLGEYRKAVLDYGEVLRRHPGNALAYAGRGLAHEMQGDNAAAIADYTEALRLEDFDEIARLYGRRGALYRLRGEDARALEDFDEAIRLEPENSAVLYFRGRLHLAQGRPKEALADLAKALDLNPKLPGGNVVLALAQHGLGRYAEAVASCTRALREKERAATFLVRGVVCAHAGQYEQALADLTRTVELDPECVQALHERGLIHTLQGRFDLALADFDDLLALEPRNALGYANRAFAYQGKGDEPRALLDLSRAMKIDPRCMLAGMHQSRIGTALSEATRRLVDYVEGVRPQRDAAEAPRPADFLVTRLRPSARIPIVAESPARGRAPAKAPTAPPPPPGEGASREPQGPVSEPGAIPVRDPRRTPVPVPPEEVGTAPGVAAETTPEVRWEEVAALESADGPTADAAPAVPRPTASTRAIDCLICRRSIPQPVKLPDGRVRCTHCNVAFLPPDNPVKPPTGPALPIPRAKRVRSARPAAANDDRGGVGLKGILLGSAAAAMLVVGYFAIKKTSWGKPAKPVAVPSGDRVSVDELCARAFHDRRLAKMIGLRWAVTVKGKVEEVDQAQSIVYFKKTKGDQRMVACHLSFSDEAAWATPGGEITLKGVCEGRDPADSAVHVSGCQIIR